MDVSDDSMSQLQALGRLHALFHRQGIEYWVFGGWAVDLHAGRLTRPHADLDVAVWETDLTRIDTLLRESGWRHIPEPEDDGYTQYIHESARLDLAFLARDEEGLVYTPIKDGSRGDWPFDAFGADIAALLGVSAHVVSISSLIADKSKLRPDPSTRAKDQADVEALLRVRREL
jgi:hypothetical protein